MSANLNKEFQKLQHKRGLDAEERLYRLLSKNKPSWCFSMEKTNRYSIVDCLGVDIALDTDIGPLYFNVKTTPTIHNAWKDFSYQMKRKINRGWITQDFFKRVRLIIVNEEKKDQDILNYCNLQYEIVKNIFNKLEN